MKKRIFLLIIVLVLVFAVYQNPAKPRPRPIWRCKMPVEFTKTNGQGINFGNPAILNNIDQRTIMFWFNLDVWPGADDVLRLISKRETGVAGWSISLVNTAARPETLNFVQEFSGANGIWYSNDNIIAAGNDHHFAVTYDRTDVANNPIFYLDGVSINVNEIGTPTGTASDDSGLDFWVGNRATGVDPMDGIIGDVRVYDSILPTNLIRDIAKSRESNLKEILPIFRCIMNGASGLQSFDGVALGAANKLVDDMTGITLVGTPAGNPIGRADKVLAF